jgi:hypothetical protein
LIKCTQKRDLSTLFYMPVPYGFLIRAINGTICDQPRTGFTIFKYYKL